jgi:hypothetical protein
LIIPPAAKLALLAAFFALKNMSAAEIHRELCVAAYGYYGMIEGTVRQWCRIFKDRRKMFMMKSEVVGHLQRVLILFKLLTKMSERRRFTTSKLPSEFPQISRTFLCEIITVRLGYHKFCAR